jgi:predicted phosphodiesterase
MKVAVLADIHGNSHALEAILADLETEKPDLIVSAGDMIGCSPYPDSPKVWRRLSEAGIPKILGNQEDFVLTYHNPEPNPLIQSSVRFMPTQYVARQFTQADMEEMSALPMYLTIEGPGGDDILVCHSSPFNLDHSFAQGIDERMGLELSKIACYALYQEA